MGVKKAPGQLVCSWGLCAAAVAAADVAALKLQLGFDCIDWVGCRLSSSC